MKQRDSAISAVHPEHFHFTRVTVHESFPRVYSASQISVRNTVQIAIRIILTNKFGKGPGGGEKIVT
jgi:hypothetical protein